jgi:hypothetical protein
MCDGSSAESLVALSCLGERRSHGLSTRRSRSIATSGKRSELPAICGFWNSIGAFGRRRWRLRSRRSQAGDKRVR